MKRLGTAKKKIPLFYRFFNFLTWILFKLFYRVKIYGIDHYFEGPAIIAANHVSYMDPALIGIACPDEIHYLAMKPLFKIPPFGWFLKKLNAHPLRGSAGDITVVKTVLKLIKEEKKILLFPEGRRTSDGSLAAIRPGLGMLVFKSSAKVIPLYVYGAFEAWPRTKMLPKVWKSVGCVFGSPIHPGQYLEKDRKEAQKRLADDLTEKLEALKQWYEDGAKGTPP